MKTKLLAPHKDCWKAAGIGLCVQIPIGVLLALFPADLFIYCWFIAAAATWGGVVCIVLRNGACPTKDDLMFMRTGFIAVFVGTLVIAVSIWKWRGLWF